MNFYRFTLSKIVLILFAWFPFILRLFVFYLHHPGYWLSLRQNLRKVSRSQYIPSVNFKLFDFVTYYRWVCELLFHLYAKPYFSSKNLSWKNSVFVPWKNFNYIHTSKWLLWAMGRDQVKHLQRTLHAYYLRNIPTISSVHVPTDLPFQPKFDTHGVFVKGAHVKSCHSTMNLHISMQRLSYLGPLLNFQTF